GRDRRRSDVPAAQTLSAARTIQAPGLPPPSRLSQRHAAFVPVLKLASRCNPGWWRKKPGRRGAVSPMQRSTILKNGTKYLEKQLPVPENHLACGDRKNLLPPNSGSACAYCPG